jgi:hypothetical protein
MSWKIVIILRGDEPSEEEVENMEGKIVHALDEAGVDYVDIAVQ